MADEPLRVVAWFAIALLIAYVTARTLGDERKARWFRARTGRGPFARRGPLGRRLNFGYPCSWQGVAVVLGMLVLMALAGAALRLVPR